jgi:16S rRNA (guanine(966)-N(2))-methyltransferase RsmD
MRITGGHARGIPIKAPKGAQTRPTSDKVRQALFNILGSHVSGKRVLDIFAGSGALAIEALSRGATYAVLIEKASAAAHVIESNLEKTALSSRAELVRTDFRSALRKLGDRNDLFNLVFIDPPYEQTMFEDLTRLFSKHRIISREAIIVVEHFKKVAVPHIIADIPLVQERIYGQTRLSFFNAGADFSGNRRSGLDPQDFA